MHCKHKLSRLVHWRPFPIMHINCEETRQRGNRQEFAPLVGAYTGFLSSPSWVATIPERTIVCLQQQTPCVMTSQISCPPFNAYIIICMSLSYATRSNDGRRGLGSRVVGLACRGWRWEGSLPGSLDSLQTTRCRSQQFRQYMTRTWVHVIDTLLFNSCLSPTLCQCTVTSAVNFDLIQLILWTGCHTLQPHAHCTIMQSDSAQLPSTATLEHRNSVAFRHKFRQLASIVPASWHEIPHNCNGPAHIKVKERLPTLKHCCKAWIESCLK